ncbi:MAG: carbohydrate ABC transporter permease [Devosia sp.]|uniref:carbohydrate ABC transporter permease n=1 Tax=Devosia sp. TaxID=1871048 RepID=UPI001A37A81D|nr:carbohydrate ABC transporter permease [Devosia sp.]MBL8598656.1 carbohydrate ABC transporter permease [Devosia sp.]
MSETTSTRPLGPGQRIAVGALVTIMLLFAGFPLLWIALTSIKPNGAILSTDPVFIFQPTLDHWASVLVTSDFLKFYANSLIIAGATVVIVMVVSTMAAYALARYPMRGGDNIAFFILSQRMMPPVAVVLPIFLIASSMGMLDRLETLIAINVAFNIPLSVWMIRGFIEGTSRELEEAAVVDGTSWTGAFLRVTVPQIWPGLLSTALFVYIYTVNEFLFASILSGTNARPVSAAVSLFLPTGVRGTLFGEAAVAAILIMLPGIIFATLMQRYLVAGVSLGAVKG